MAGLLTALLTALCAKLRSKLGVKAEECIRERPALGLQEFLFLTINEHRSHPMYTQEAGLAQGAAKLLGRLLIPVDRPPYPQCILRRRHRNQPGRYGRGGSVRGQAPLANSKILVSRATFDDDVLQAFRIQSKYFVLAFRVPPAAGVWIH